MKFYQFFFYHCLIMSDYWFINPFILFKNIDEIIPSNNQNRIQNSNAIARFSLFLALLIWIGDFNKSWLGLVIFLLLISWLYAKIEKYKTIQPIEINEKVIGYCTKPTRENPYMNYTLGDHMDNPDRSPACSIEKVRTETLKEFRKSLGWDSADIWGQSYSDRAFFTNPNTGIVSNQTGFALSLLGDSGRCKTTGFGCLKISDPAYQKERVTAVEIQPKIAI